MCRDDLIRLKENFYDWCSLLSIDEVVSNYRLIAAIERIERELVSATYENHGR